MPRTRPHNRLDIISDAATAVFIRNGFAAAGVAEIAREARVGPGTIYLYAASKDALFDLALRRALEDPTVWTMVLPHPAPLPGAVADAAWRCLQNAAHFPQLWLAAESPSPPLADLRREVEGIIGELYGWLHRYRRAIKLVERCAGEWPDVAQVFHRRFWRGGIRRVADYLGRRMQEGRLPRRSDPNAAAHLLVESLAWMAVHRHWSSEGAALAEASAAETAQHMLLDAVLG
ncbi:MAG TPA: helix-turn-helix domain-containing protein [Gemmatimonadales bacterium]|nr:helix-turn-helix domain-containing protein [Gemmatimonadales bacterium]